MSTFEQAFGQSGGGQSPHHNRKLPSTEFASEHCLLVVDSAGQESVYPVRSQLVIGSGEQCDIALMDPSIAAQHVAIDTDGTKFWYSCFAAEYGVQCNGESSSQGWLSGGEEILLGGAGLYFFAPQPVSAAAAGPAQSRDFFGGQESSAPQIAAPAEFGNYDMRSLDVENDLLAAASVLDEEPVHVAPPKEQQSNLMSLLLFLGIYILQIVAVWMGYQVFVVKHLTPPAQAKTKEDVSANTFNSIVRIGALAKKNQWRQADVQLRQAMTTTPKKHPMFPILQTRNKQISAEVLNLNLLSQARQKTQDDQWVDALGLIARIPNERFAYKAGQALRVIIFEKKVKPLLSTIGLQIEAKKFSEARNNIERVLAYDPNLGAAVDLQQRLDKADPEGAKKANEAARIKFGKGFAMFRKGQFQNAVAYFKQLEATSSGLVKRKAASYQRRAASFVSVLQRGLKASRRGKHSQAIRFLVKAHSISREMGGSKSKYARSLSRSLYEKGKAAARKKRYGSAVRYYKRSVNFSGYGPARSAISRLKRKARSLYKQALVLKGVDNREARKLLRQVMSIMPSSSRLYRKARRSMR